MRGRVFRTIVFSGMILLSASPLALAENPATTEAVYACSEEADDLARLACYDAAVGRLQAAEEAGEIATVTREEVETVQREGFGFSIPSLPALAMTALGGEESSAEIENIVEEVDRVTRNSAGKAVIYLTNGQVWRQTGTERVTRRDVSEAEIVRAAFGSFKMKLDGGNAFRVTRVQ